jgi:hypothetical protein
MKNIGFCVVAFCFLVPRYLAAQTYSAPIEFLHSYYGQGFGSKIYFVDEGSGVTSLRFATRGNTATFSDALYIKASPVGNGFIGVGTITPVAQFQINSASADVLRIQNPTGGVGNRAGIDFSTYGDINGKVARIDALDMGSFNGSLAFYTDGDGLNNANTSERMRITETGAIGVGISTPLGAFHINQPSSDILRIQNSAGGLGSKAGIDFSTYWGTGKVARIEAVDMGSNNGALCFYTDGDGVNNANVTERLRITESGNIGIGTPDPGSFKLAVNGKIWTQEVNVQMTNPGPDYVFEKNYDLLPLNELETYIDQNKHLPEVPSAKEMEKDGLNLKEMNLILLKKVEELTLHLIEKDKQMIILEKRVQQLEK